MSTSEEMGVGLSKKKEADLEYPLPACRRVEDWPWAWAIRDTDVLDWKREIITKSADPDEMIQDQALSQRQLPVRITNHLYLGNAVSVQNVTLLQSLGITAVLNMAGTYAIPSHTIDVYKQKGIAYKQIDAEDDLDYPLLQKHWLEAKQFLDKNTGGQKKCVVNCVAGINRSSLIVSTYYMLQNNTCVLETVKHIREQRGNIALYNESFQEQLLSMARKHNLLGPPPGSPESVVQQSPPLVDPEYDWRLYLPPGTETDGAKKETKENPLDRLANL